MIPTDSSPSPRSGLTPFGKIDLLRGVLAWLVVVCHAFATAYSVHPSARGALTPSQYALLDHTVNAGFVWVMGFFVISGYCIHQSVSRRLNSPSFSLKAYMIARLSRILPLYYVALAFAVIADPWITSTRVGIPHAGLDGAGVLGQIFLVQNLTHCFGSFTPSWSLTNEVFYYAMYGVLVAWVGRYPGRPFWIGVISCVAIGGLLQMAYLAGFRSSFVLRWGMLFGLGFNWFLGVGVAVGADRLRSSPQILRAARCWPLVLAASFAGYHQGLTIQFAYLCSGVAFALMLIRIVAVPLPAEGVVEPAWATRVVRFAGLSSYPTYLFHFTLMWLLAAAIVRWDLVARWETMMGILIGSSLVLGGVLGWVAERPLMRSRSRLLSRVEARESSAERSAGSGRLVPILRRESA